MWKLTKAFYIKMTWCINASYIWYFPYRPGYLKMWLHDTSRPGNYFFFKSSGKRDQKPFPKWKARAQKTKKIPFPVFKLFFIVMCFSNLPQFLRTDDWRLDVLSWQVYTQWTISKIVIYALMCSRPPHYHGPSRPRMYFGIRVWGIYICIKTLSTTNYECVHMLIWTYLFSITQMPTY